MKSRQEVMDVIAQANATEAYHRFSIIPWFPLITDGVLALAEAAGCYWLLDIVGSYQSDKRLSCELQVWTLEVNLEQQTAVVTGSNDDVEIIRQEIPYTDFPLESVKLFLMDGILLLPRER